MRWRYVVIALIIAVIIWAPQDASNALHNIKLFLAEAWQGLGLH